MNNIINDLENLFINSKKNKSESDKMEANFCNAKP